MNKRMIVLWLAMLATVMVCAAGSYEHVVIVPQWTKAPPASLAMFSGPYALDTGQWWRVVHLPTILLTVTALVLFWRDSRRRLVGAATVGYLLILILTAIWILPELIALTGNTQAAIPPVEWKARANTWEALSLVRLALMYINAVLLIMAAYPPANTKGAA